MKMGKIKDLKVADHIEFVLYKNKEAEIVDEEQSDSFLPSGIN